MKNNICKVNKIDSLLDCSSGLSSVSVLQKLGNKVLNIFLFS